MVDSTASRLASTVSGGTHRLTISLAPCRPAQLLIYSECGMATLFLVRHGETAWNREGRWQGQHDEPLSEVGREQAAAIAERLAPLQPHALHASDLARAWATALAIGETTRLTPLADPRLREVDVGEWRGLTPAETAARYPAGYARWGEGGTGWRDGETYGAMRLRAVGAIEELLRGRNAGSRIVVVTHGGVIRALVLHALGLPDERRRSLGTGPTATLTMIEAASEGPWRLLSFNDSGHLPADAGD